MTPTTGALRLGHAATEFRFAAVAARRTARTLNLQISSPERQLSGNLYVNFQSADAQAQIAETTIRVHRPFRKQAMKFLRPMFFILLCSASFAGTPLPVSVPSGSSLQLVKMSEEESSFAQEFSGSIRVRGTFEAQWTQSTSVGAMGTKRLKPILSVAFRPDPNSTEILPFYSNRGGVKEVWLWPANEVIEKLLSTPQARAVIQRRIAFVSGSTELLLTNYRIEVTCDSETYSAKVTGVFSSGAASAASAKTPKITDEGC
jgi:hypothetical protein